MLVLVEVLGVDDVVTYYLASSPNRDIIIFGPHLGVNPL